MWDEIETPWKIAFMQGWEAFKNGSVPIGAVITDENGNIISKGRNRIYENDSLNPKIAHAETECLLKLDLTKYPNVRNYTLYTCMEPCPMCFGTFIMSNFRRLKIAARDSYCGAVYFRDVDPYIKSKNVQVEFGPGVLQVVQLTLQSYFEIKACGGKINHIVELFYRDCSDAVETAKDFYKDKYLDYCAQRNIEFRDVFNAIISSAK
ncbi:MAG: nucleoside deaminase [Clostridiaceae bacterium]|nr:nucleoside deaminase [Clostridiaceae bacterium]